MLSSVLRLDAKEKPAFAWCAWAGGGVLRNFWKKMGYAMLLSQPPADRRFTMAMVPMLRGMEMDSHA